MTKPVLTLTTDFGLADHYVGAMKGVVLGICPQAQLVDISHQVKPFAIEEGAYLIAQAYRYFPKRTVHVVVVDPGVGSERRPILMEAAGQYFVAPDNGVLGMIYAREMHKVRQISSQRYFLQPVSRTFHGRDIFAPVAAHLAAGVAPARMGKRIADYVRPPFERPQQTGTRTWVGRVLTIDRFGNVVTNFHVDEFSGLEKWRFLLAIGGAKVRLMSPNYAAGPPGRLFLMEGSSGYLEVARNLGSAAEKMGCQVGAAVELTVQRGMRMEFR
jgi:hypothetical protein